MAEYLICHAHPQQELTAIYGSFNRQTKLEVMQNVCLVINKWCNDPGYKLNYAIQILKDSVQYGADL